MRLPHCSSVYFSSTVLPLLGKVKKKNRQHWELLFLGEIIHPPEGNCFPPSFAPSQRKDKTTRWWAPANSCSCTILPKGIISFQRPFLFLFCGIPPCCFLFFYLLFIRWAAIQSQEAYGKYFWFLNWKQTSVTFPLLCDRALSHNWTCVYHSVSRWDQNNSVARGRLHQSKGSSLSHWWTIAKKVERENKTCLTICYR